MSGWLCIWACTMPRLSIRGELLTCYVRISTKYATSILTKLLSGLTVNEHTTHCRLVMDALCKAKLHCHPVKCKFYQLSIDFLGHHILEHGVKANDSKCDKIQAWLTPKCSTDVRAFLGLVRYITVYLPQLAEHTQILTPLTSKESTAKFPKWLPEHQSVFDAVKDLVTSWECLMAIDHENSRDRKIFMTCDVSDWCSSAVLSFSDN